MMEIIEKVYNYIVQHPTQSLIGLSLVVIFGPGLIIKFFKAIRGEL